MECPRCKGHMISQYFEDISDDTGYIQFSGYRCINCGEILDPVIMANRKNRPHMIARNRKLMSVANA